MKLRNKFSRQGGIGLPIPHISYDNLGRYLSYQGDGVFLPTNNSFPQKLLEISKNSPTHGRAIQVKTMLTYGQGINMSEDMIPPSVMEMLNDLNDYDESINDLLEQISNDLILYGGFALKVKWNFDKTIGSIECLRFEQVRIGINNENEEPYYIVNNDWDMKLPYQLRKEYRINKFNPNLIGEYEIVGEDIVVDDSTMMNAEQLIYCKNSRDEFYPTPDYMMCLDAAINEVQTGVYMNNTIKNGVNGAYMITVKEDTILDDENKQLIVDELHNYLAGEGNSGSIMFMPTPVELNNLEPISPDTYLNINTEIRQRLLTGHGIPPILLEVQQGGGFNNRAEEMTVAFKQFTQSSILSYQQKIVRYLNSVISFMTDEEFTLEIVPFIVTDEEIEVNNNEVEEEVVAEDETSLEND